ncbi:universal stress protein [Kocuria rosea]|uniref:universal stress protein n=1 Tax=Kocuria rosea TaxID=1275 RepID=UPI0020417656|nr:universal stress protein [Kocuria rosea]MCM3688974.1 universal stress protein [Kocuria rosea]
MAEQIVLGYDGSQHSDRALEWALREAAVLSAELQVVVSTGRPVAVETSLYGSFLAAVEEEAGTVAGQAVARAQERGVPAVGVVARGDPAGVLVERSRTVSGLVLGRRGRRGVRGRVGSVSAAVAAHARCPVVVLPGRWTPGVRASRAGAGAFAGRVVVGVDRLGADNPALVAATCYAGRHGLGLTLLTVVPEATTTFTGSVDLDRAIRDQLLGPAQAMVGEVAEEVRAKDSDLTVETHVLFGVPADELVEAGRSAELVVVGSRGYGGFRGLLMGSVSQAVLHGGESPVMIIPTGRESDPAPGRRS